MPVDDHPTHPDTIKTSTHPGCYNRPPMNKFLYVNDGFYLREDGPGQVLDGKHIPHVMSTECQAAKQNYPECSGCKHQEKSK